MVIFAYLTFLIPPVAGVTLAMLLYFKGFRIFIIPALILIMLPAFFLFILILRALGPIFALVDQAIGSTMGLAVHWGIASFLTGSGIYLLVQALMKNPLSLRRSIILGCMPGLLIGLLVFPKINQLSGFQEPKHFTLGMQILLQPAVSLAATICCPWFLRKLKIKA